MLNIYNKHTNIKGNQPGVDFYWIKIEILDNLYYIINVKQLKYIQ